MAASLPAESFGTPCLLPAFKVENLILIRIIPTKDAYSTCMHRFLQNMHTHIHFIQFL